MASNTAKAATEQTGVTAQDVEQDVNAALEALEELKKAEEMIALAKVAQEAADAAKADMESMRAELADMLAAAKEAQGAAPVVVVQGERQRVHTVNAPPKPKMVKMKIPKGQGEEGRQPVYVCVNGYPYLINRGKEVTVPDYVKEVWERSQEQDEQAQALMAGLQKEFEEKSKAL